MTPIQPLGSAGPIREAQPEPEKAPIFSLPDSSPQICRADTSSAATPPEPSRLAQFRSRYAKQVAQKQLRQRIAQATRGKAVRTNPSLLGSNPLALLTGCTHPPIKENGGGGPVGNPDPDRPMQNPNGKDGGLGAGINTTFAGVCLRPLDLDLSVMAGSALMTCGVNGLTGNSTGISVIERIDAGSGTARVLLQLPTTLGSANSPVFTTTSASGSNGVVYTGFAPRNTPAELQSNSTLFSNSGVFTWNEANSAVAFTTFDRMQIRLAGTILPISLETHQTVLSIRPNGPVSMVRVGDHLFVLSENRALNPGDNRMTNAPATVHRYSIAADGKLTQAPVAGVQPGNVKVDDPNTQTNAILLDGMFHPTAIGDVGDGRIAMVIQGSTDGTNRSSLVVNTTDFGPGFNVDPAHPDDPVSSTIPLIDANKPGAPDFAVNDSTQISIVGIGGVPHALVGSSDGSGRIAVVNLDKNPVENRVRFVNVFDDDNDGFADDGGNIANIVTRPGSFAYVISDTGKARAVTLDTGTSFGAVGKVYSITSSAPAAGTQLPSLFVGNSILVARPGGYSKAPLN